MTPNIVACVKYSQICCSKPSWPRFWHLKFPLFLIPPLMNPFLLHTLFSHLKPDYNLEVKKKFQLCMNKQKWDLKVTFWVVVIIFCRIELLVLGWDSSLIVSRSVLQRHQFFSDSLNYPDWLKYNFVFGHIRITLMSLVGIGQGCTTILSAGHIEHSLESRGPNLGPKC